MPEFISILRWIRDIVYPQLLETNENVKIVADNIEEVKALNISIEDGVLPFEKIATTTETIDSLLTLSASNGDISIVKEDGLVYIYESYQWICKEWKTVYSIVELESLDVLIYSKAKLVLDRRSGDFIYDATKSTTNNGGTIFDGWVRQYSGAVNVKWFGAVGDGTVDDTLAIQMAIDFCISLTLPVVKSGSSIPTLLISGKHYITATLNVDRPTNQNQNFIIKGDADNFGGFVIDSDIYIFGSTYAGLSGEEGNASNQIVFKDLNFASDSVTAGRIAFDMNKFVRYSIEGCSFIGIRLGVSISYVQTCRISNCTVRACEGSAIEIVEGWYDGSVTNCIFESVNGYALSMLGMAVGFTFDKNLIQSGLAGITFGTFSGGSISNNYIEAVMTKFLTIGVVDAVSINSNIITTRVGSPYNNTTTPTFYEIVLGECNGGELSNNNCNYKLLSITGTNKYINVHDNKSMSDMPVTKVSRSDLVFNNKYNSRTFEVIQGYYGTVSSITLDLGGSGNTAETVIIELVIAGYNQSVVDYIYTSTGSNTPTINPRSTSSVAPVHVSGTCETTVLSVSTAITHPVVKLKVTCGGYTYNNNLDINPIITFNP